MIPETITIPAEEVGMIIEAIFEDLRPMPNLAHIPDSDLRQIITHMITEHPEKYLTYKGQKLAKHAKRRLS